MCIVHALRGAYGIEPDLSCFGKVIGGGLPAAAYGGKAELMAQIAPDGPVYQAGRFRETRWPCGLESKR